MISLPGQYDPNHKPEYDPDSAKRENHKWAKYTGRLVRIVTTTSVSQQFRSNYDRIFRRPPMLSQVAVNVAIGIAAAELRDWGGSVNWNGVKIRANETVKEFVHPDWLEEKTEKLVDAAIDAIDAVCKDAADVSEISKDLAGGDYGAGVKLLKNLMVHVLPAGEIGAELGQLLAA